LGIILLQFHTDWDKIRRYILLQFARDWDKIRRYILLQFARDWDKIRRDILLQFERDWDKTRENIFFQFVRDWDKICSPKVPTFLYYLLNFTDTLLIKTIFKEKFLINIGTLFPAIARFVQKYEYLKILQ